MTGEAVGFIGLGKLGIELAPHIAAAGFPLTVYDVVDAAGRAPSGATVADSVREVAERSTLVFLCLPSIKVVDAVVDEIAAAAAPERAIVVNTSTVGPSCATAAHGRLAARGIDYADATISAIPSVARARRAVVMFSGARPALDRLRPVFDTFARKVQDLGSGVADGQRMKVLNNCLVHAAVMASFEAVAWGVKGGLDLARILEVLAETSGRNMATDQIFPEAILSRTWESGGSIDISRKDMEIFLAEAEAAGTAHPFAGAVHAIAKSFQERHPGVDQTELYRSYTAGF